MLIVTLRSACCTLIGLSTILLVSCPRRDIGTDLSAESPYKPPSSKKIEKANIEKGRPIRLYFYDRQATVLVPVTRYVSEELEYPKVIFDEMTKGPVQVNELAKTIYDGTIVLSARVANDVLTLDFSKEVIGYGGGSVAELGLILSLQHAAKQIEGVKRLEFMIETERVEYLPEGTGVKEPILLTPFVNNFDPAADDTKVEMYLMLTNTQYLVPTAIAANDPAQIASKLKDPMTYGGIFDDSLLSINFDIKSSNKAKMIAIQLDDTLLELPEDKREIAVKSIVYSVFSFVETRADHDEFQVTYNGDEIVTLLNLDLTKKSVAESISLINEEGNNDN